MGTLAVYKCNNCGNQFEASKGGGFNFVEYRCVKCDYIKGVPSKNKGGKYYKKIPTKLIGVCNKCGGELDNKLHPMCPKCKKRDVTEKEVLLYYD